MDIKIQQLAFLRGSAIESYSGLEFSLVDLFAHLLGTDVRRAGTVFYRITNSRAADTITTKLLKLAHGKTYNHFWNSLFKLLQATHADRNKIVHWRVMTFLNGPEIDMNEVKAKDLGEVFLIPANIYDLSPESEKIGPSELAAFSKKCKFLSETIEKFSKYLALNGSDEEFENKWHEIFRTPIDYPPQPSHPLSQTVEES